MVYAIVMKPPERVFWVVRLTAGVEHLAAGRFNVDFAERDGGGNSPAAAEALVDLRKDECLFPREQF